MYLISTENLKLRYTKSGNLLEADLYISYLQQNIDSFRLILHVVLLLTNGYKKKMAGDTHWRYLPPEI